MYAELFQLVYYRVLLATEAQASRFVTTVESDEWQDKLLTGGAENLVRSVCLGGSEDEGEGRMSDYLAQSRLVRRVLNGLDKPSLRQVKLTNVRISLQALTGLSGLRELELDGVTVITQPGARPLAFPNLTLLALINVHFRFSDDFPADPACLLSSVTLPSLTALRVVNAAPTPATAAVFFDPPAALLAQLDSLQLQGVHNWLRWGHSSFWDSLVVLKHLATSDPAELVQWALGHLPSALATLDVSVPFGQSDCYTEETHTSWDWDTTIASLGKLEWLTLPTKEGWTSHPKALKPASWLAALEAAARARSAKVEFK